MKIIGIIPARDITEPKLTLMQKYTECIESAGGTPIILPYTTDDTTLDSYIELCDGFLFTGGVDIHPSYYGEEVSENCGKISPVRDEFELMFLEKVLFFDKPAMFICRGIQLLNVALGGTLYQDIPSEYETDISHRQKEEKYEFSHDVFIEKDSPFFELFKKEKIRANSFHHQAIKDLAEPLMAGAYADDGIVEAVYSTEHEYVRGYQWHPERLFDKDFDNEKIFEDFVGACGRDESFDEM